MARVVVPSIAGEFSGAELGDARRSARLLRIGGALGFDPKSGFPKSLGSEAELEAFYRFINNPDASMSAILMPHSEATVARARRARDVVVVHDTTVIEYDGKAERVGLGYTTGARLRQGFFAHVALVLTPDGLPLGVAHVETHTRSGVKSRARTATHKVIREDRGRESLRWVRGVTSVEDARDEQFEAIHVTDAEGDFFELLGALHEDDARFVIRAGQLDRRVICEGADVPLRHVVDGISARSRRRVQLSERKHVKRRVGYKSRRKHPDRARRMARLAIGASRVHLKKTKYSDLDCEQFALNVVRVWEEAPPPGEPAVEWVLLTTEDVGSSASLDRIVDVYRMRWTIEEYFKALKTGCSLEKRQVESYDALRRVLALFVPIAYRLLLLRGLHRHGPTANVRLGFDETELQLLIHAPANAGLPIPKSLTDGLQHLARLGGHLKNNGPPGWLTLSRGYETLLMLRLGWQLAEKMRNGNDQS